MIFLKLDTIGKYLKQYRIAKNMRQEDLAEKAELSVNYIGMVERGEKVPSLETFITLLNVLEVSADMVLADVLLAGYTVKTSLLSEKIAALSLEEKATIYEVVDTLIKHAK